MDFGEVVSRVKQWISRDGRGIEMSSVKENERRLDFTSQNGSFFVTVPQNNKEEWVWLNSVDHAPNAFTLSTF